MPTKTIDLTQGKKIYGTYASGILICRTPKCTVEEKVPYYSVGREYGVNIIRTRDNGAVETPDEILEYADLHDIEFHNGEGDILYINYISTLDDRTGETGVSVDTHEVIKRSKEF